MVPLRYHAGLDILHNPTHVFTTDDWEAVPEYTVEPSEVQDRVWVSMPQCLKMIVAGEIVDSLSIVGLLAYQTFGGGIFVSGDFP